MYKVLKKYVNLIYIITHKIYLYTPFYVNLLTFYCFLNYFIPKMSLIFLFTFKYDMLQK